MFRLQRVGRDQAGAVFIQVGLAVFVLMAFNVFVLDYGILWVARGQAQNAVDAGALAGAVARSYDDYSDPPPAGGQVALTAQNVAQANLIWQGAGTATVSFDCPPGVTGNCTRVNITRSVPTLFGPLLDLDTQDVRATATAVSGYGNASPCVRPFAIPDTWRHHTGPTHEFNGVAEPGGGPLPDPDEYVPPSATERGDTMIPHDVGYRIIWPSPPDPSLMAPITRTPLDGTEVTFFLTLRIPGTEGEDFRNVMENCPGQTVALGQMIPIEIAPPGHMQQALSEIISNDVSVTWDDGSATMENSCAPGCAAISPRLIPIVLFDPQRFQLGRATGNWTQAGVGCPTNDPCVRVSNIVGFFVHGEFGSYAAHGHILRYPGSVVTTAPTFHEQASWLVTQMLVR
jgi:Flp pilus assembly protein TadG